MSRSDQEAIDKYFPKKPIAWQPGLATIFQSLPAGVLLYQLLYWRSKGRKKGWVYKTAKELELETGLTRTQQETAIRILTKHGVLEVRLKGVPATRHFRLDMQKLHELIPSLKKTRKLEYLNPPIYYVENDETITKITRKTTSNNKPIENKYDYVAARNHLARQKSIRSP